MAAPSEALRAAMAGRYEIERELCQGGTATVYLARDLRHHRRVAIKVLKPDVAASLGAERFLPDAPVRRPAMLTERSTRSSGCWRGRPI